MGITIDLCYVTLYDITPSLYLETLGNICARFESPSLLHISLPYITSFDTKRIHPRNQITCSHTSCCHHCRIHFVLFHNITCYTCYTFPSHISQVLTLKEYIQEIKLHALTHHVVIIAVFTLSYSIISHATLILYYQASMLTLRTSLILHALCFPQA
jgi:hypothetical protein